MNGKLNETKAIPTMYPTYLVPCEIFQVIEPLMSAETAPPTAQIPKRIPEIDFAPRSSEKATTQILTALNAPPAIVSGIATACNF